MTQMRYHSIFRHVVKPFNHEQGCYEKQDVDKK